MGFHGALAVRFSTVARSMPFFFLCPKAKVEDGLDTVSQIRRILFTSIGEERLGHFAGSKDEGLVVPIRGTHSLRSCSDLPASSIHWESLSTF